MCTFENTAVMYTPKFEATTGVKPCQRSQVLEEEELATLIYSTCSGSRGETNFPYEMHNFKHFLTHTEGGSISSPSGWKAT